eukprot:CAMPEP_0170647484 /NCGR_PEP_ID=MMETSP0224-20130122/44212_1 /TAXON_ID=285029 /ORGANISM="Togula jolla, Strain CCCM 725" /LENGTH=84 /DNA_ID=CAMNT_0010978919 /DNA_START=134 /DNA_END=388 /DNA_ORIENTATION=+
MSSVQRLTTIKHQGHTLHLGVTCRPEESRLPKNILTTRIATCVEQQGRALKLPMSGSVEKRRLPVGILAADIYLPTDEIRNKAD